MGVYVSLSSILDNAKKKILVGALLSADIFIPNAQYLGNGLRGWTTPINLQRGPQPSLKDKKLKVAKLLSNICKLLFNRAGTKDLTSKTSSLSGSTLLSIFAFQLL